MVLCSRCKKRPAVVFITSMQGNEKKNEGLCMVCAKESNIPQISEYMEQMGITDDDLEQMSDQTDLKWEVQKHCRLTYRICWTMQD